MSWPSTTTREAWRMRKNGPEGVRRALAYARSTYARSYLPRRIDILALSSPLVLLHDDAKGRFSQKAKQSEKKFDKPGRICLESPLFTGLVMYSLLRRAACTTLAESFGQRAV